MNTIDKNEHNGLVATTEHKRHRSITNLQLSTTNRMKRKVPCINSDLVQNITKKLDVTKSTEFEPRDQ